MVGYQRKHIWFDFRKSSLRSQKQVHFRSQMSFECILNKNISSVKTALQLAEWFILKEIDGEEPGSIPARPCRFSRSESSVVFCINTCEDPLERPPTEGTSPADPGPINEILALPLQPNQTQTYILFFICLRISYVPCKNGTIFKCTTFYAM